LASTIATVRKEETLIMTRLKALVPMLLGALALFAGTALQAATVQPCLTNASLPGPNSITVLPIFGGNQIYCQSAFGWSDTWFANGQPSTYDQHLDVLSGDNAPSLFGNLSFGGQTAPFGSGNAYNFISPWLDGGNLNASFIGSDWLVVNDITVNGNVGTSEICLGGGCTTSGFGLFADIVTTVDANGITEQFTFTNNLCFDGATDGAAAQQECFTIDSLFLDDYFNFHANGSQPSDIVCPTTTYAGGVVTTTGGTSGGCSPIVHQGTMFGSQGGQLVLPGSWDVGTAGNVLADIAAGTYNFSNGPCTGDCAADLVWSLGSLAGGQSVTFTIAKTAPEPATLGLLGFGLLALGFFRRRR
jgi:hypothetical protein